MESADGWRLRTEGVSMLGCLLTLVTSGCAGRQGRQREVLRADFEMPPAETGWEYRYSPAAGQDAEPTGEWVSPGEDAKGRGIRARTGHWESPSVPVTPFGYYEASFSARGEGDGYLFVLFEDAANAVLDADHCTSCEARAEWSRQTVCFRARVNARRARLRFAPIAGRELCVDDVVVEEVDRGAVAAWADGIHAEMPTVKYEPEPGRWRLIARSMERLRKGGTLRIVMLGDSIINDTANSAYDVLLDRMYPGARVEVVSSVRGGTGCRYYREEGRVKEYVLDHRPDLLMIGGISQNGDTESIREVIRQVRGGADPEIMLLTGPCGTHGDPRRSPGWEGRVAVEGEGYAARLKRLAEEEGCEFLDMARPWGLYMKGSSKPYEFFMRDAVHANTRGRQVLARILQAYFAPGD